MFGLLNWRRWHCQPINFRVLMRHFPRPLSLNKVLTLKQRYVVGKTDKPSYLKHQIPLRVASPCFSAPRVKCLRISSIKGSAQNDESGESLPSSGASETGT